MPPVRHILVAIDFTPASTRALEFARMIADATGASLRLLHVLGHPLTDTKELPHQRRDVCERLATLLDECDRHWRHATVSCIVGTPAHDIAEYAARNDVDLIVMGTHAHGPAFRMVTGSIADVVIGSAPCAVLAVKSDEGPAHDTVFDSLAAVTSA